MESAFDESEGDNFEALSDGKFENPSQTKTAFNEVEEMELAAELLEVNDEAELDQFLGKLLKNASRAVGGALKNPLGRMLGGYLKGAIKKALPTVGGAFGNYLAPDDGGALGGRLASNAGHYFGLELEGLSAEDREFEVARQLVRFGGAAATQAEMTSHLAGSGAGAGQMAQAAQDALLAAAQRYAPGFIRAGANLMHGGAGCGAASTCNCGKHSHRKHSGGSWVRRGQEIHLLGV